MPAQDHHHTIVIRSLTKAGWTVLREQFTIAIGEVEVRRMYIDLQVQSQGSQQIVLMEIKAFDFVTYNPDTEEIVRWIPPL
jgi:Holliday junction resolvase-like predicted endonuclease